MKPSLRLLVGHSGEPSRGEVVTAPGAPPRGLSSAWASRQRRHHAAHRRHPHGARCRRALVARLARSRRHRRRRTILAYIAASIFAYTAGWSPSAAALALRDASVPRVTVAFALPATARPGAAARPATVSRSNGRGAMRVTRQPPLSAPEGGGTRRLGRLCASAAAATAAVPAVRLRGVSNLAGSWRGVSGRQRGSQRGRRKHRHRRRRLRRGCRQYSRRGAAVLASTRVAARDHASQLDSRLHS